MVHGKKKGMKKKYKAGEATQYISRKHARKKLQLTLADFRRLCILKGIYPREPKNRKKAGQGKASYTRTYYFTKDIQWLMHEPLIEKFRGHKAFLKKIRNAQGRRDWNKVDRVRCLKPVYRFDHIVIERYPSFNDALRDMDDALCMIFMFARLPKSSTVHAEMIENCRRISMEWMNYCIYAQCLRKVFVSIRGYYYQVELKGETITWLVPHEFAQKHNEDVDYRVMRTFTEFYLSAASFTLYKLYTEANLKYPPFRIDMENMEDEEVEKELANVEALTLELRQSATDMRKEEDDDMQDLVASAGDEQMQKAFEVSKVAEASRNFFKGTKIFISRECPRKPLAFIIRSLGGEVSWDKELFPGATFNLDDDDVTHLIIDRPTAPQKLGRVAVQPQWIFDCCNFKGLLPTNDYVPGCELPPHLSPFVKETEYQPPEMEQMERKARAGDTLLGHGSDSEEEDEESEDDEGEEASEDDGQDGETEEAPAKKVKVENEKTEKAKRAVKEAKRDKKDQHQNELTAEERKLAKLSQTNKKRKRLLERIEKGERKDTGRKQKLEAKRKQIDQAAKKAKVSKKAK